MDAMEVVVNYLPGDQRLVDKIVYELKSQGIFDQFRKECFADVDTKPAYQNLRQRVEGNVSSFLRDQSWRPDMNKNQVREMLRKKISESGYLETGVERIVDQVVNPKINSIFLPKVEEVVYRFLGIQKPGKDAKPDLLPTDLEAVSPEPPKKDERAPEIDADDGKVDEDESPPFEPLDEQVNYIQHEDNSIDSHLSGFSALASHESNSNEIKIEQDSRHSSDSRLSVITSDENTKMDAGDDSKPAKAAPRPKEPERGRSDRDRKSSGSRSRHASSSKDKERKGGSTSGRDKKSSRSASHRHGDSRDRTKSESSRDKSESGRDRGHYDKSRSKPSSTHKSWSHKRDKERERDRKKPSKSKDDHYSAREKRNDRRSTDRDSNDGNSSKNAPGSGSNAVASQAQQKAQDSTNTTNSADSGNSDGVEKMDELKFKVSKPKFAANIKEAMKMMKIRKQLAKLEKQNELRLSTIELKPDMIGKSIDLEELEKMGDGKEMVEKKEEKIEETPVQNAIISQDSWDEMERKLQQVVGEFEESAAAETSDNEDFKYFEPPSAKNDFVAFVENHSRSLEKNAILINSNKRKCEENDLKNNNSQNLIKKPKITKINHIDGADEAFPLPLSPAESNASKEEVSVTIVAALKTKRTSINRATTSNSQRYSSDDLYKPRSTFTSSRRRGAKQSEN